MKESTSSSFMIILAKIIDMKLAKKWLVTKKLDYNKYIKTIKDIENLITFYNYSWGVHVISTMKKLGYKISKNIKNTVYKVALIGYPNEKICS